MIISARGYKIPEPTDLLQNSVRDLADTFSSIEQDIQQLVRAGIVAAVEDDFAAVSGTRYLVDTLLNTIVCTLPVTPQIGDYIEVWDVSNAFAENATTIARNGSLINGLEQDYIAEVSSARLALVYTGPVRGWQIDTATAAGMRTLSISANISAEKDTRYIVNTLLNPITITLTATPQIGDYIEVIDASNSWSANNLTIDNNGALINGVQETLVADLDSFTFSLTYTGSVHGWHVTLDAAILTVALMPHTLSSHSDTTLPALTISANASTAAMTVTQTGTGNAFVVEGSASPDNTPFVIDGAGRVLIGTTSNIDSTNLQISSTSTYLPQVALINQAEDASAGYMKFSKRRGDSTIVSSGDAVGNFAFVGWDGTAFINAAFIGAAIDGTPGTNDMPGRLVFATTADGVASPTERMRISSTGGISINNTTDPGTGNLAVTGTIFTNGIEVGYKNIPQNSQSVGYTCLLADSGKHILETTASTVLTIPANASVAYIIGTELTFVNTSAGTVSIAITTDTMTLANTTTTGTRTLARNGIATALKIDTDSWLISGTGLT